MVMRSRSVKVSWSLPPMTVLEVQWSQTLSLVCEVGLIHKIKCYTNPLLSLIYVNTTEFLNITCFGCYKHDITEFRVYLVSSIPFVLLNTNCEQSM